MLQETCPNNPPQEEIERKGPSFEELLILDLLARGVATEDAENSASIITEERKRQECQTKEDQK